MKTFLAATLSLALLAGCAPLETARDALLATCVTLDGETVTVELDDLAAQLDATELKDTIRQWRRLGCAVTGVGSVLVEQALSEAGADG